MGLGLNRTKLLFLSTCPNGPSSPKTQPLEAEIRSTAEVILYSLKRIELDSRGQFKLINCSFFSIKSESSPSSQLSDTTYFPLSILKKSQKALKIWLLAYSVLFSQWNTESCQRYLCIMMCPRTWCIRLCQEKCSKLSRKITWNTTVCIQFMDKYLEYYGHSIWDMNMNIM